VVDHAPAIRSGAMVVLAGMIGATTALQLASILIPRVQALATIVSAVLDSV
jgi:hypothetical protein